MNDVKRVYGLGAGSVEPVASSRPSLEGMISTLFDRIECACKQVEDLNDSLGSVLYPQPTTQVLENAKQPSPVVPPAIERLEGLCRKVDKLNDGLGSIQSRLCL